MAWRLGRALRYCSRCLGRSDLFDPPVAGNGYGKETTEQTVRGGFEIEDTLYAVGPITWVGAMPPFIAAAGIGTPIYLLYAIWEAAGHVRRNR